MPSNGVSVEFLELVPDYRRLRSRVRLTNMFRRLFQKMQSLAAIALATGFLAGCNGRDFSVQPAQGKVLCKGEPVTGGSITFIPIGEENTQETGKVATATIKSDGTFVLSTYGRFDGAILGKHRVEYIGNGGDGGAEDEEDEPSDNSESEAEISSPQPTSKKTAESRGCVQDREIIVEVTNSKNDFTIEL